MGRIKIPNRVHIRNIASLIVNGKILLLWINVLKGETLGNKNYIKKFEQTLPVEEKPVEVIKETPVIEAEPELIIPEENVDITPVIEKEDIKEEAKSKKPEVKKSLIKGLVRLVGNYSVMVRTSDGRLLMVQGHTDAKVGDTIEFEE